MDTTVESVKIIASNGSATGYKAHAIATMADGSEVEVLSWFDDELTFTERDFLGRTQQEIISLFHERDIAYLQS